MDIKVFVIHYKKLTERKAFIIEQFTKFNLTNYEFVSIDRDEINNYDLSIFSNEFNRTNNKHSVAILLSHIHAITEIKNNYDKAIIFEDDVIFSKDFSEKLERILKELPSTFDMAFLGDGCWLHIPSHLINPHQLIYKKCIEPTDWGGDGITRCVDSYIVNKKCAITICNYIDNVVRRELDKKINYNSDWWFNIVGRDCNLEAYWIEPTIVTQGSQNSLFKCSYT